MKKIEIVIAVKEEAYGELLARAIAETGRNLDIKLACCKNLSRAANEERRILITDLEPTSWAEDFFWPAERTLRLENKLLSISEILRQTYELAYQAEGKKVQGTLWKEQPAMTFGFYSPWGGSGTTSLAIVTGRLLCGSTEAKILYLSLAAKDQYQIYLQEDCSSLGSKKELLYRLEEGLSFHPSKFMIQDSWGLYFLKPEEGKNIFFQQDDEKWPRIVKAFAEDAGMDLLLLDLASCSPKGAMDLCENIFCVTNKKDCRHRLKTAAADYDYDMIFVENRSPENGKREGVIQIGEDAESFTAEGEKINLSANKSFAVGARPLAQIIEERRKGSGMD